MILKYFRYITTRRAPIRLALPRRGAFTTAAVQSPTHDTARSYDTRYFDAARRDAFTTAVVQSPTHDMRYHDMRSCNTSTQKLSLLRQCTFSTQRFHDRCCTKSKTTRRATIIQLALTLHSVPRQMQLKSIDNVHHKSDYQFLPPRRLEFGWFYFYCIVDWIDIFCITTRNKWCKEHVDLLFQRSSNTHRRVMKIVHDKPGWAMSIVQAYVDSRDPQIKSRTIESLYPVS